MAIPEDTYIPVPNTVRVDVIAQAMGQRIENVYNVLCAGPVDITALDRIYAKVVNWVQSSLKPLLSNSATVVLIVCRDLTTASGLAKEYAVVPGITGAVTGTQMPLNVTCAIKWSTGFAGRSFRGRTYHLALASGQLIGQQLQPAVQSSLVNVYAALITGINATSGDQLVVVSRYHLKAPRPTGLSTPITGCSVELNTDSQRRRLNGRGN